MTITFTVPGTPVAKGRPRFSRKTGHAYTPAKTRHAEESFIAKAIRYAPEKPLEGPISIEATFYLPIPKSWPKWKREAASTGAFRCESKPDIDNLAKGLIDAMNEVFFGDDRQIYNLSIYRRYSREPRTEVTLKQAEQATRETERNLVLERNTENGGSE